MANGTDPEKELTPSQKRKAIRKSNRLETYKRKAGKKEAKMQESVNKALDPNYSLIGSAKDKIKSAASTIKTDLDAVDRYKIKADLQTAFPKVSKDIQSITKRKVADDLRTAFTPNTDVKVESISKGVHAGQVKKTKTKYKKGSERTEVNIKKKKTTYNPPTATKTPNKKITHKSKVGDTYSKTKYFKHGKAKGQVKEEFKTTVTDKKVPVGFSDGSKEMNILVGKGTWNQMETKTKLTRYNRKGNVKYTGEGSGKKIKPTQAIKAVGQTARMFGGVVPAMGAGVAAVTAGLIGGGKIVRKIK